MEEQTIRERLETLACTAAPAIARFDADGAPRGRWAVLPSAWNPPTRAHLRLLELAAAVEGVGHGAALLTTRNVAKGVEGASLADRIGMLLAVHDSRPAMAVLAVNQARIVDQAAALRAACPQAAFDFALGYDTLVRLFDEHYYAGGMERELDRFFARHRAIVANRGEVTAAGVATWVAEHAARYGGRIVTLALGEEHGRISSSAARAHAGAGSVSSDVPGEVAAYIRNRGLYRGKPQATR